eukprot:gene68740-94201_t
MRLPCVLCWHRIEVFRALRGCVPVFCAPVAQRFCIFAALMVAAGAGFTQRFWRKAQTMTETKNVKKISRRNLLKAGATAAGAAAGSGLITGFPTIWAQEIKDIELRHVGVSYSVVKAIGDQASKDLGFKVTMQNLDTSASINRFITQPNTVDIADLE